MLCLTFKSFSRAFRHFKGCMGGEYSACIAPSYFVTASVPILQSYQFVSIFNQMHYVCGAGMQSESSSDDPSIKYLAYLHVSVYLDNEDCMSTTWGGETGDLLNACRYSFEQKGDKLPDNACFLANTFTSCFEQQFQQGCGLDARDTQFWGCEYARVEVFTRFPQCEVSCVLPYAGGIIG
ncbi:hypothetical protein ANCDUO_01483 [Ancylostoma duodenale]|uniref:Uncharacterized protein n=1 Tax=Ancylostoma duodenale TaxID=51022 RepID=A0A0C2HF42_9BILA|nr:hypothetical protein ANCDUO_01483 [Ancylostoma duodenale]